MILPTGEIRLIVNYFFYSRFDKGRQKRRIVYNTLIFQIEVFHSQCSNIKQPRSKFYSFISTLLPVVARRTDLQGYDFIKTPQFRNYQPIYLFNNVIYQSGK